eukprot:456583_1
MGCGAFCGDNICSMLLAAFGILSFMLSIIETPNLIGTMLMVSETNGEPCCGVISPDEPTAMCQEDDVVDFTLNRVQTAGNYVCVISNNQCDAWGASMSFDNCFESSPYSVSELCGQGLIDRYEPGALVRLGALLAMLVVGILWFICDFTGRCSEDKGCDCCQFRCVRIVFKFLETVIWLFVLVVSILSEKEVENGWGFVSYGDDDIEQKMQDYAYANCGLQDPAYIIWTNYDFDRDAYGWVLLEYWDWIAYIGIAIASLDFLITFGILCGCCSCCNVTYDADSGEIEMT